jgi:hypothetical protein
MPDPGAFSYRTTKDGRVLISWNGRVVVTLAGDDAAAFHARVDGLDDRAAQLLMAARTGNFKRGNEGRQSPRNP